MPDLDLTDAHAYLHPTRDRALAEIEGILTNGADDQAGADDEARADDRASDFALDQVLQARDASDIVCTNVVVHLPWEPFQARIDDIPHDDDNPIAREEEVAVHYLQRIAESNGALLAEAAEHDGVMVSCVVDPARMTERQMLEEVEAGLRGGASGIFISPAVSGADGRDRRYHALFDYCQEVGAPIVCAPPAYHAGGDSALGRPAYFGWTIRDFPRTRVIFAAMGWTPELSDDGERDLLETIGRFPDVCVDLSLVLGPLASGTASPQELAALIWRIGAERVLFASGSPFVDAKTAVEGFWKLPLPDLELILIGKENWSRLTS